jgi:anti-anti-sigma factor
MPATATAPRAYYGHVDGTFVLKLAGPIRFVAAQALRVVVDGLIAGERAGVLIDLRSVDVIDSTGMGLLARVGRSSIQHGRRASIACADNDVAITLRSAAFDELFVMLEGYPFDDEGATLAEVPLDAPPGTSAELGLGRVILDAHRDLAGVSERNRAAYRDVIAALEADLLAAQPRGGETR